MDFVKPKPKIYHFTVDPNLTITLKRPTASSAEHFQVSLGHQPNCTRSPQEKMKSSGLDGPGWEGRLERGPCDDPSPRREERSGVHSA